jgi:hypothetical protein
MLAKEFPHIAKYSAAALPKANWSQDISSIPTILPFCPRCKSAVGKTLQIYVPIAFADQPATGYVFQIKVVSAEAL